MEALQRLSNYLANQLRLLDEHIDHYLYELDNEADQSTRAYLQAAIADARSQMRALDREYETVHLLLRKAKRQRLKAIQQRTWPWLVKHHGTIHRG